MRIAVRLGDLNDLVLYLVLLKDLVGQCES